MLRKIVLLNTVITPNFSLGFDEQIPA